MNRMPPRIAAAALTLLAFVSAADAQEEMVSLPSAATSAELVATALQRAEQEPLIDPDQLATYLSSNDTTALTSFSNLPMITAGAADAGGEDQWTVSVNFAIWAPSITGDIGIGRFTTHVNASFLDILEETDSIIGVTGMVRVTKGKIGAYFGGTYDKLGADVGPRNRTQVTSTIGIMSFGLSYEVGRWAMNYTATDELPARDLQLLLTAGGRYYGLLMDIDFNVLRDRNASDWWIDPMVGAVISVPISQHFSIVGLGELGGFGVASDFAWTASLSLSWDFHIKQFPSSLSLGYLAIGDDYESGSGSSRREWNTILHGVLVNFTMHF